MEIDVEALNEALKTLGLDHIEIKLEEDRYLQVWATYQDEGYFLRVRLLSVDLTGFQEKGLQVLNEAVLARERDILGSLEQLVSAIDKDCELALTIVRNLLRRCLGNG